MKFNCELKRVVDDSYDIEIGRKLQDTLVSDLKGGLVGKIKKFAVPSTLFCLYTVCSLEILRTLIIGAEFLMN